MKAQRKRINRVTKLPIRTQLDTLNMYLSLGYTKSQAYDKIKMSNYRSEARLQFAT